MPRVLLLSATPYKMYTAGEDEGNEDHYRDFQRTVGFLLHNPDHEAGLAASLREYRQRLYRLPDDGVDGLAETRDRLEAVLRGVMIRNERLAASKDRNGMLEEVVDRVGVEESDVRAYTQLQRIVQWLEDDDGYGLRLGDQIEYWKSAPYLLNFMERYQLKRVFSDVADSLRRGSRQGSELADRIVEANDILLPWAPIDSYNQIDPGNPRLRGLLQDTLGCAGANACQLLWIRPAAPYYRLGGPFAEPGLSSYTKRLVFSSWYESQNAKPPRFPEDFREMFLEDANLFVPRA